MYEPSTAPRLTVIGGGISGLAAARAALDRARELGKQLLVEVLEKQGDVGGRARTIVDGSWVIEAGPNGYLDSSAMQHLVRVAGMDSESIQADPTAARRFVARGGRPREVTLRPHKVLFDPLLGPSGWLGAAREPFVGRKRDDAPESLWHFARRRFGRQIADRLVAPMALGVFAGDAKSLCVDSAFPRLREWEKSRGSVIRGALARRRPDEVPRRLCNFRQGMQSLPRALAAQTDMRVRRGVDVRSIERIDDGRYGLQIDGSETLASDAVVLAVEPWVAADLIETCDASMASDLRQIKAPPVIVVALGVPRSAFRQRGFGVLVPRGENVRMLGCLWESFVFEGRSAADQVLVRSMYGGAVDPQIDEFGDEQIEQIARDELRSLLGIEKTTMTRLFRWPRAIPQYDLEHRPRVQRIEQALGRNEGLFLAGTGLHGVAFAKAAESGLTQGRAAAESLLATERET